LKKKIFERWDGFDFDLDKPGDISFIQRGSTWLRGNAKTVFILFRCGDRFPFAVAKIVRDERYKDSIEREFQNLNHIRESASFGLLATVPRPLLLDQIEGKTVYLETALTGRSLSQILTEEPLFGKRKKVQSLFEKVCHWLKQFYADSHQKKTRFSHREVEKYILDPMDIFSSKFSLNAGEKKTIEKLKTDASQLEGQTLPLVCQHGDFGGGAVLVRKNDIGVIDWEFFSEQNLPLFDLFKLIIHPGFSYLKSSGYNILDQFKAVFELDWYAKLSQAVIFKMCHDMQIDPGVLKILFPAFLINLINSHHGEKSENTYRENGCRELFQYYCRLSIGKNVKNA